MRAEPVMSVRQRRLAQLRPEVETVRQRTTIEMSERVKRGFKRNATRIAKKQGITYDKAAAILAASTRRASAAARRKNPRLKRVRGKASSSY
jgi:hypothetical protein